MMRIKYKTCLCVLLAGMFVAFPACQDTVIIPDDNETTAGGGSDEDGDLVPIMLDLRDVFGKGSPATYTLTPQGDVAGTPLEDKIADVFVYIFRADGTCEKIIHGTGTSLPIGPELITTGVKDFLVVVNDSITTSNPKVANVGSPAPPLPKPGEEGTITYAQLHQRVSATRQAGAPPVAEFLMTGQKNGVIIEKKTEVVSLSTPIAVDVARTVSKVTLNFTKSAKAENKNITISKVTLMNGADRVGLFEAIPPPVGYTVEKSCTGFERSDALGTANDAIPNTITGFRCVPVDTFYTYENLAGKDKSHATYFELEASVGGSAKTCKVYLAEDPKSVNDTVWDVKRNYWYDVHLDIIDPGFDSVKLTIISSPWNMADTQKVVIGDAGYEVDSTALPLKLVKNYTSADQAKDAEMLAIDKHSRGASWINLVVTDGTPWELVLPQGVIASADSGKHWTTAGSNLTGTGNDVKHRVYVYRPYVENAEPASGFSFYLNVDGTRVRDFVVQPRDTMPIPTNCYILRPQLTGVPSNETHAYIPLEGVYRYWEDCLLANGDTIPAGNVTAELLWADRAGVVQNVSVPPNVATKREKAYILAEAGAVQGNAVIAMKVNGTIYWSFHLWVTEYNPYEAAGQKLYTATKNIFMDRNLGALVNKDDAAGEVRGLYYQFGRKDPFPRTPDWAAGNSYMNGVNITVASAPAAVTVLRPLVAIPAMLKAPMTFYTSSSWPFLTENAYLWSTYGGNKTAFDPCPEGWRIPEQTASGSTNSPWKDLTDATFPLISTLPQRGRSHPDVGHYPFSGYMTGSGVTSAVTHSYYWTSLSTSDTSAEGLGIDNTSSVSSNSPIDIDRGVSVRCVADLQYLRSASGGGLFGSGAANMIDQIK